ncbi:uncharacterized protein LOC144134802 isoform X2 [Amblyomma americanum]
MREALFTCFLIIALMVAPGHSSRLLGGWRIHDPYGSHKYAQLALFALTGRRNAGGIPGIAIRLHHVASQSHHLYGRSKRGRFDSVFCIMAEAMNSCTATVHEVPWTNFISVEDIKCLQ